MTILASRQQRRALEKRNRVLPAALTEVPRENWPAGAFHPPSLQRVWRSSGFLVQQHEEPGIPLRLSINRTALGADGRWKDGITWDEIQSIKREAGYGERFAIEIFPADVDLVNVASVRHIWLLDEAPAYAWRRHDARG